MKHIFILNPVAGNGTLLKRSRSLIKECGQDCEIYETASAADATAYIKQYCNEHTDEELRFYACGGDGTIKAVAEGVLGNKNASMTCFPIGSGNDFVKYFGGISAFADIEKLTKASAVNIDMIKIDGDGEIDSYSVNVANFGFEAAVCAVMNKLRGVPVLGGKNAYTLGILKSLFTSRRSKGKIVCDGKVFFEGDFLLSSIANASYVGGGYCCAPSALVDDGLLEITVVKPLSIIKFAKLLTPYKKGEHLTDKRFEKVLIHCKAKTVEVFSDKAFDIALDGEMIKTSHFTAKVLSGVLRFAAPNAFLSAKPFETAGLNI